jgi:general secretion pathway protein D
LHNLRRRCRKAGLLSFFVLAATLSLALPLFGQDKAPGKQNSNPEEENLPFKFHDASFDAILSYVSRTAGYTFVIQAPVPLTVTAVSQTPIPKSQVIDFLNTVLKPKGIVALVSQDNPRVVEIVSVDEAKRKHIPVRVGADPAKMVRGDQVIIQVIPLQALEVAEFDRELRMLLPKTAEIAKDTANNALILTDSADNIHRFLLLLSQLEGMKYDPLKLKVIELKNADSADVARVVQEFVKKEQGGAQGKQSAFSWQKAWFPDSPDRANRMRSATSEIIKAIPEPKGNLIVLVATEENLKLIESLISQIDQRISAVAQVKIYKPRGAGAKDLSDTILQLFRPEAPGQPGGQSVRQTRQLQWWDTQKNAEVVSIYPIKALADARSNTLMVTATAEQLRLIDRVVESFDLAKSAKIYQLRFADAKPTADFVNQLLKGQQPEASALADARTNTLVVSASEEQIALLDGMISEIDKQIQDSIKIRIFPLKNASADDVAQTIGSVLKPTTPQTPGGISVRPIETTVIRSTNSLLVRGPDQYFKLIEEVIAHHEQVHHEDRVTFVVKLNNASAKSVADILRAAVPGKGPVGPLSGFSPGMPPLPAVQGAAAATAPAGNLASMPATGSMPQGSDPRALETLREFQRLSGQGAEQARGPAAAPPAFEVFADDSSNTLVVRTAQVNVQAVKDMIAEIDRYRPQVLIRVLIAEVTLDNDLQYGVQFFHDKRISNHGDPITQNISSAFPGPGTGFTYSLTSTDWQISLNAIADQGRLRVLSTPRILALDNQAATLSTGQKVPFITSSQQSPTGSLFNTVQYIDVGVILKVTPRITSDGMVTMQVRPEVSQAEPSSNSIALGPGVVAPVFDSNYAETMVTVKSGQTVILGGLIRDSLDRTQSSIPFLGDLPLIGSLFGNMSQKKQQRELMIFITPEVVSSSAQLEELTALERGRLKLIDQRSIDSEVKRWLRDTR